MEVLNPAFGEWLRARRRAFDLTQSELAQRVGCAEDTIGRIEAGTRRPSKQVAALLADALGVPLQSQGDFVRFAREGGFSAVGLEPIAAISAATGTATATAAQAPARDGPVLRLASSASPATATSFAPAPPHLHLVPRTNLAAWTPYLSTLPQPPTPLIDREAELDAATCLLRSEQGQVSSRWATGGQPHVRLLTLTGPPGVGKTRLAIAIARALTPAFPDGICFVPLAPLRDPALLALTVSRALDLADDTTARGPHAARLLDFLRDKRLLLVLDNFEHILGATSQVSEWLSASVHLQVLVTSRSALNVRGERLFPVSPLPVPPIASGSAIAGSAMPLDPVSLAQYPSVSLFVERAQAIDPTFKLTRSNSRAVAELCVRMEGIPLAVELTAARSARLAPEIVLARLERRLDIASGGSTPRDLPRHQQTLRTAIEWSYDLLNEDERLLFTRMSVFAGGATLGALETVCNAHGDINSEGGQGGLAEALEGLFEQSLVNGITVEGEEDCQAGRRFSMLEMLREYAAERLEEREPELGKAPLAGESGQEVSLERDEDEAAPVRRYHAEYYLAMAEAAGFQKSPDEQVLWLDRLERDHDNLRAAIGWAIHSGRMEMAARLCGALWNFWKTRGYVSEGRSWLNTVLANPSGVEPLTLARAMNAAGALARFQGDYTVAKDLCEQGLAIYMERDDKPGIAESLDNLGVTLHYMGRIDEAEAKYQESAEVWHSLGGNDVVSRALQRLAMIVGSRNNRERAISLFRQTLAMNRTLKDKAGMCNNLYNLGVQSASQWDGEEDGTEGGPGAEAKRYFTLSFALASKLGNRNMIALSLIKLGELSLKPGDEPSLITATALLEEGLARVTEMGDTAARAHALHDLGFAALLRGDRAKARKLYDESLELSQVLDDIPKVVMNLEALAIVHGKNALASGSHASAVHNAGRAVQLYASISSIAGLSSIAVRERHYRATMDEVRGLLSEVELSGYHALGQQMTLDEAVSFARAN